MRVRDVFLQCYPQVLSLTFKDMDRSYSNGFIVGVFFFSKIRKKRFGKKKK